MEEQQASCSPLCVHHKRLLLLCPRARRKHRYMRTYLVAVLGLSHKSFAKNLMSSRQLVPQRLVVICSVLSNESQKYMMNDNK